MKNTPILTVFEVKTWQTFSFKRRQNLNTFCRIFFYEFFLNSIQFLTVNMAVWHSESILRGLPTLDAKKGYYFMHFFDRFILLISI